MTLTPWRNGSHNYAAIRARRAAEIAALVRDLILHDHAVEMPDYPTYYVTPDGRVFSASRRFLCLRPGKKPGGYRFVGLRNHEGLHYEMVHRLVAKAFIPNPKCRDEVNHKNGNKDDNDVANLEWVTRSENARHAVATGLMVAPRKLEEKDREAVRIAVGSYRAIGMRFGICAPTVCNIKRGPYGPAAMRKAA
jgi:hypothetical protein